MILDRGVHAACVDAWLEQSAKDLSSAALRRLLEVALAALWARTTTTLGEVTLTAIGERILYTAVEKYPFLASFKIEVTRGIELRAADGPSLPAEAEMREGVRFLLVEFLSVLGNLTAEILTPELHGELGSVVLPQSVRLVTGIEGPPGQRKRQTGEGGQL